jgi:hypothetical protein
VITSHRCRRRDKQAQSRPATCCIASGRSRSRSCIAPGISTYLTSSAPAASTISFASQIQIFLSAVGCTSNDDNVTFCLVSAWCRQALPHSTDRATFSTSCERSSCAPTSRVAPLVHRLEPQRPLGRRTDRFASHGVQPSPNHFIARSLDVRNAHHVEAVDVVVHVASARAQHGIPRQPPRPDTQVTTLMAQKHCCLSRRSDRRDSEHAPHQRPLWRNQSDFFTLHSDVWYIWNKPQIPKAEGTG